MDERDRLAFYPFVVVRIACRVCSRSGSYRLTRLSAKYGPEITLRDLTERFGKHNRCIVPATSFCEYADTKPRKRPKWFALSQDRPLFAFAGLWTPWRGVRGPKSAPVDGQHELFGFLTTEANAGVAPIHPKAMPVILTTPAEIDLWLLPGLKRSCLGTQRCSLAPMYACR